MTKDSKIPTTDNSEVENEQVTDSSVDDSSNKNDSAVDFNELDDVDDNASEWDFEEVVEASQDSEASVAEKVIESVEIQDTEIEKWDLVEADLDEALSEEDGDDDIPELSIFKSSEVPSNSDDANIDYSIVTENNATEESSEYKNYADDHEYNDLEHYYQNVLEILRSNEGFELEEVACARISEAMSGGRLAQLVIKDLIAAKTITKVQLARAIARAKKRKEITSFLAVPSESMELRRNIEPRVSVLLREKRVIPLWHRVSENKDKQSELHLAYDGIGGDSILESALSEIMPDHTFIWHFANRDVCGSFWLTEGESDVDASMEAETLLDKIIGNAIDARSSDIHIDPSIKGEFKALVKYRVDGIVQSKEVITLDQLDRLKVRIENIARMPKVDLNHPNKGAFTRNGYDWRVQIQPHAGRQGPVPRIVIRRLHPEVMPMELLGYPKYFIDSIKEAAKSPNGVIFWTGPTGSGKTESIHSAVVSVNPMGRGLSVHTIEDPPEKRVSGYAVQMEIAEKDPARSGMELMKSSLRADPDVVIFGEVRDAPMAKLVFEAANTGHLVFTTLHTNTSLDAVVRLDEIGVHGFMMSYVRGIAAQRLLRRLCVHCRIPVSEINEYTKYIFDKYEVDIEGAKLYNHDSNGCASCNHSGYYGRIAIAEWLTPNKELIEASIERDYANLEEVARRAGWKPMGYMGVLHVKAGVTDIHELASKVLELSGDIVE